MAFRKIFQSYSGTQSFNMTPMIDIVFLLIIFFLVVFQFIEAENFPVAVPENCEFAEQTEDRKSVLTTVTVMKTEQDKVNFAVGSQKIAAASYPDVVEQLTRLIDMQLKDLPAAERIVTLRIDEDIDYFHAQYALAAVSASTAGDIQLAVFKEKRAE